MPSSVVKSYSYNSAVSTLRIVFVSGMVYEYKDVPAQVYAAMTAATSKGRFLNLYIKPHYSFEKISDINEGAAPDAH